MPPGSSEWEATCILSGGVSGRVASGYNIMIERSIDSEVRLAITMVKGGMGTPGATRLASQE